MIINSCHDLLIKKPTCQRQTNQCKDKLKVSFVRLVMA